MNIEIRIHGNRRIKQKHNNLKSINLPSPNSRPQIPFEISRVSYPMFDFTWPRIREVIFP